MPTRNHELAYIILKYELGEQKAKEIIEQLKNRKFYKGKSVMEYKK